MTRMDLPSEPEESGRAEQASAGAERLSPKSRELPDPDERGRVYEASRAHAEARAAEWPEQVSGSGRYWNEVPRLQRMWVDEALRKDFSWCFTPVIVEWERGDFADELVEVSHEQASKIIEYFREQWGPFGQSLDS
jgi:hypothetical protein